MKHVRFYEEFVNTSKKKSLGTVVAAFVGNGTYRDGKVVCYEALSGVYDRPDAPVASGGVSLTYLRKRCKRVSEVKAREIHPLLFAALDE